MKKILIYFILVFIPSFLLIIMFGVKITMIIIIIILIVLSALSYFIVLKLKSLAKKNKHFTNLGNEQGKIIMKENNAVDVLSKMNGVFYDELGDIQIGNNPKKYGSLFNEFGIIFFGISPIKEIYTLPIEWREYVEKEANQVKKGEPNYGIIPVKEKTDYFKRFYSHAIQALRVEMKDGSKVDLVFTINFEILNIIQVLFRIKPDGIMLAQAEIACSMAIQDTIRLFDYQDFRDNVDKSNQNKPFVYEILKKTNDIIEKKFFLRAVLLEINFFELSKGEAGDEDFEKAQKAKKLAEMNGDARILTAEKNKKARKIDGEGDREYFEEIAKIIGTENIPEFANLEQVKGTQLLSYGSRSTPIKPVVDVTPNKKGSTP